MTTNTEMPAWPTWPNGMKKNSMDFTMDEYDAHMNAAKKRATERLDARIATAIAELGGVLASKTVPNGRWAGHTVQIRVKKDGRFLYCNGWSDPFECSYVDALRYYDENVGTPA